MISPPRWLDLTTQQPLTALPLSLMPALQFGMAAFTTFRAPLVTPWVTLHLKRLCETVRTLFPTTQPPPPALAGAEVLVSALKPWVSAPSVVRLIAIPQWDHLGKWACPTPPAGATGVPEKAVAWVASITPYQPQSTQPVHLRCISWLAPDNLATHKVGAPLALGWSLRRSAPTTTQEDLWCHPQTGEWLETTTASLLATPQEPTAPLMVCPHHSRLPSTTEMFLATDHGPLETTPMRDLATLSGLVLLNSVQGVRRVTSVDGVTLPWPPQAVARAELLADYIGSAWRWS